MDGRLRPQLGTDGHRLSVVEGAAKSGGNSATFSTLLLLCLAKTLSVPEINSLRNFLNRRICYDYGPCSTFRGYV